MIINNHWTPIHGKILNEIFSGFSSENIDWLVIRNYEGLPFENRSKDVDIAIKREKWDKAIRIVKITMKLNGFIYYDLRRYSHIRCFIFFSADGKGFKFDIFGQNEYRGITTHTFENLDARKVKTEDGVFGSCALHNAMIVFLRPLLGAGVIKKTYIPEILSYYEAYPEEFHREVARICSKNIASKVIAYMSPDKIHGVTIMRKAIVHSIMLKNIKNHTASSLASIFSHYYQTFKTKVKMVHSTPFISVQGADGVGKSTFIDNLAKRLAVCYVADESKVHLYHHRPSLLPNLSLVGEKAKIMKADTDFTKPHRAKQVGFVSSLLRMIYYWLDYFIGTLVQRFKDANSDIITLYDRYIYDFLVDPQRTRIKLPYWIRKIFVATVWQPRVVFVLIADAETIYKRKQELTIDEINQQLDELKRLAKTNKRFVIIDADQTPEKMVDDAIKIILDRFTHKILRKDET